VFHFSKIFCKRGVPSNQPKTSAIFSPSLKTEIFEAKSEDKTCRHNGSWFPCEISADFAKTKLSKATKQVEKEFAMISPALCY
jgi:hypothetical protein